MIQSLLSNDHAHDHLQKSVVFFTAPDRVSTHHFFSRSSLSGHFSFLIFLYLSLSHSFHLFLFRLFFFFPGGTVNTKILQTADIMYFLGTAGIFVFWAGNSGTERY